LAGEPAEAFLIGLESFMKDVSRYLRAETVMHHGLYLQIGKGFDYLETAVVYWSCVGLNCTVCQHTEDIAERLGGSRQVSHSSPANTASILQEFIFSSLVRLHRFDFSDGDVASVRVLWASQPHSEANLATFAIPMTQGFENSGRAVPKIKSDQTQGIGPRVDTFQIPTNRFSFNFQWTAREGTDWVGPSFPSIWNRSLADSSHWDETTFC